MRLSLACLLAALFVSACGGGDTDIQDMCGAGGTCPTGFTCNPVTNRCVRGGGTPDARPADAMVTPSAPDTTITSGPAQGSTVTTLSVTFGFTSDKTPATFECRVDMAAFAACTTPHAVTVTAGAHTFDVRAISGGLTDPTPASRMFTVDLPPDTTITSGPQGDVTSADAIFTFTSSEPTGATFRCRLDNQALAACPTPKSYTGLALGSHTFTVAAVDSAGNEDPSPATRTFNIVLAPLDTMIISGPPLTTQSRDATFTYTANRAGATFDCRLDTGDFEPCNGGTRSYTSLADGEHTFEVRAVVGTDVDDSPAVHTWTNDVTGLVAVIAVCEPVTGTSVTYNLSASNPAATFACGLDGAFEPCDAAGETVSGLVHDSSHTFRVRARLGDVVGPAAECDFVVDGVAPVVDISAPLPDQVLGGPVTVSFGVSEEADLTCTLNGNALGTCASGMVLELADGDYQLVVSAEDAAGNTGSDSVMFSVDLLGPSVQIASPTPGSTTGPNGNVILVADAGALRVECTLDDSPINCELTGFPFEGLLEGSHTATAQAFDAATGGNGGEIATVTWDVDATPPLVRALVVTDVAPGTARLQFTITDDSGIQEVRCRLDPTPTGMGPFVNCGFSGVGIHDFLELTPGAHVAEVFAVDVHGNSGQRASSAPPPATFARIAFTHVMGPGHLALIGTDYQDQIIILAKPGVVQVPPGDFDQLLANAVSLAPAVSLGFNRGVNIAFVPPPDPNDPENQRDNVIAILDSLGVLYTLDEIAADEIGAALPGNDLILICDQGDTGVATLAPVWEDDFQDFLAVGGNVLVSSGTFEGDGPEASNTWRILAPSLLTIDDADTFDQEVRVPCNEQDPLVAGTNFPDEDPNDPNDPNEPREAFVPAGTARFDTLEPWVTLANDLDEGADDIVVLHRWFGDPPAGPVALSTEDESRTGNNLDAFFQNANSSLRDRCRTLDNGTAVHHMDPGGYASLGLEEFGNFNTFSLQTVVGVQPLDHINVRPSVPRDPPVDTIEVDLPAHPSGMASVYHVDIGCDSAFSESSSPLNITVPFDANCQLPPYNIVAEAYDPNDVLLGFKILLGVTAGAGAEVDMTAGGWTAPNLSPDIQTGGLSTVTNVTVSGALVLGPLFYEENTIRGGGVIRRVATGLDFANQFYSATGGFDHFDHRIQAELSFNAGELTPFSDRLVHGPLITSLVANLAQILLPRLGNPVVTFPGGSMVVTWGMADGSLAAAQGGVAVLQWNPSQGVINQWQIFFPSGASVTAPAVPPGDLVAPDYWPAGTDPDDPNDPSDTFSVPAPALVQLVDVSFFFTYDDFRNGLWIFFDESRLLDFLPGVFDLRATTRRLVRGRVITPGPGIDIGPSQ